MSGKGGSKAPINSAAVVDDDEDEEEIMDKQLKNGQAPDVEVTEMQRMLAEALIESDD